MKTIFSEAAEKIRAQLDRHIEILREEIAALLEDYDALAATYQRVMRKFDAQARAEDERLQRDNEPPVPGRWQR